MATREETKKMIEVMQAYVDGKDIEFDDGTGFQSMNRLGPDWNWFRTKYRIIDKPKPTKKVKLLAYFGDRFLQHMEEGSNPPGHWKRVPSEDKEIEVEV